MMYGAQTFGAVEWGGLIEESAGTPPETITIDKWFMMLFTPVREKDEVVAY